MSGGRAGGGRAGRRRAPGAVTVEQLERAALHHLARYATSRAHLRRLLLRRLARAAAAQEGAPAAGEAAEEAAAEAVGEAVGEAAVERLLDKLARNGLLDDAAYAEGRARSLRRRGASAAGVRAKLAAKGVDPALTARALQAWAEAQPGDPELAAAVAFARGRRLGPWRPAAERAGRRLRDLAALARQGFPAEVARKVVDAEDEAVLQSLLEESALRP